MASRTCSDTIGAKPAQSPAQGETGMATRATHARLVEVVQPGRMRRFATLSMAALLGGVAFGSAAGDSASAARVCGERHASLEQFAMQQTRSPRRWASAPTAS
jgi:hypothetical protein